MEDLSAFSARPGLAALLDHFAEIADARQGWKVMYSLREVLLLVVCGTIASGDDYDDIVDWGKAHLAFLRGFAEFHFGILCADWLRCIINRTDPQLFVDCFSSWVAACWPDKLDLVAIDGKTSRRTHNRRTGHKALHLVSAFATNSGLVLGQEALFEKSNEITAIPALIERSMSRVPWSRPMPWAAKPPSPNRPSMPGPTTCSPSRTHPTTPPEIESYFATGSRSREGRDYRQGPWRFRGSQFHRFPSGRLVFGGALLSGRAALFPSSPPSRWSRVASNAATRSKANGDPTSPPARSRRRPSLWRRGAKRTRRSPRRLDRKGAERLIRSRMPRPPRHTVSRARLQ
jgi:hypothetical protein